MAGSSSETPAFLNTVEGEISFFRSIMRARPIGIHRHFHVLTMRSSIHKETGHWVAVDELWQKLRSCYDIDALDAIDIEAESYESQLFNKSNPLTSLKSPSKEDNLMMHPFFREEYTLPLDSSIETIVSTRRISQVPSPPSSPESSITSGPRSKNTRSKKRSGKSKASMAMAGLLGGESDSSDLTDSGEDGPAPSEVTGTDGADTGTVDGEDDDTEMQDLTHETTTKSGRQRKPTAKKAASGRARAAATSTTRPAKKRKR